MAGGEAQTPCAGRVPAPDLVDDAQGGAHPELVSAVPARLQNPVEAGLAERLVVLDGAGSALGGRRGVLAQAVAHRRRPRHELVGGDLGLGGLSIYGAAAAAHDLQDHLEAQQRRAVGDRLLAAVGGRLRVAAREGRALDPRPERLLALPARVDEVARLALDRPQQLEAEEAGHLLDLAGALREALLELGCAIGADLDRVDLDHCHAAMMAKRLDHDRLDVRNPGSPPDGACAPSTWGGDVEWGRLGEVGAGREFS